MFNTGYSDYQSGFGDLSASFWLGLDAVHWLTSSSTELYIGLHREDPYFSFFSVSSSAYYKSFQVGSETEGYPLTVSDYQNTLPGSCSLGSTAGDSLTTKHNGKKFSTHDKDQDMNEGVNCASNHKGGWWYGTDDQCHFGNLNSEKITWRTLLYSTAFTHSVMAIR